MIISHEYRKSLAEWRELPVGERHLRLMLFRALKEEERRAYQDAEDKSFAEDVDNMAKEEARKH